MKRLKSILRWVVGLVLGSYLAVILLLSLPFVQNSIGEKIASVLSEQIGSRVSIGRVQLGLTGKLIIDDVHVWDRQGKPMLTIARTGARMSLIPFLRNGDIHINNALLFGAHATLYQEHPDSLTNFQYVIDAFSSGDDEKKPLPHISIGSVHVRHTSLRFDQQWKPETPDHFNPGHLHVTELGLNAQLHVLTDDSLSLSLRRLDFKEKSGLCLTNANAEIVKNGNTLQLTDLELAMPNTQVSSPLIQADLEGRKIQGAIHGSITPSDASAFLSSLKDWQTPVEASLSFMADTLQYEIHDLQLNSADKSLTADIPHARLNSLKDKIPGIEAKLRTLTINPSIRQHLQPLIPQLPEEAGKLIDLLGETSLSGNFSYFREQGQVETEIITQQGKLEMEGKLNGRHLTASLATDGLQLGRILEPFTHINQLQDSMPLIGKVVLSAETSIQLPDTLTHIPKGTLKARIREAGINNYNYHNIDLSAANQDGYFDLKIDARDPALTLRFDGKAGLSGTAKSLQGVLDVQHFRMQDLHLARTDLQDLRLRMGVDLEGEHLDNLTGHISVPHIILTDEKGPVTLTHLQIESQAEGNERHITFESPYARLQADGEFQPTDLVSYCQQTIHQWIPGIVKAPTATVDHCQGKFSLTLTDPSPLERLAGIPLHLNRGPLQVQAQVNTAHKLLEIKASAEQIGYGNEDLLNLSYSTHSQNGIMGTELSARRIMKDVPVDIHIHAGARDQLLTTRIEWDNHQQPAYNGAIALEGTLNRQSDKISVDGEIMPTTIQINDTTWNIQRSPITFHDGRLGVKDFRMTMEDGNRWLSIYGHASRSEQDTLHVDLRGIELAYVFQLAKVRPLTLAGKVSGKLYGTQLFARPEAHGHVTVPHILFNNADMGTCDAELAWGVTPGTLDIKARMDDPDNNACIDAKGYLHLVKDPIQSLDLDFTCQRANAFFLNHYVSGIMEDIQGRATGHVRVFGPFKGVDLEGDAVVEEAALTIPALNVRYHVQNERVRLHPGGLILKDVHGYDPMGDPGTPDHYGIINGEITYEHFQNMKYNFNVTGENILAYNFPEYGDLPFCGVVYGSGDVTLSGRPGVTTIDINARPTPGTLLQYKVATPETLTQSKFITFIDRNEGLDDPDGSNEEDEEEKPEGDMHINFNLDITPDAEMRLLMDPTTGDNISLFGSSRLKATYYNKGSFRMYGTYHVDHGTYRMSIQDVIRKDFQFRKGGTIVFGGSPFQADLGLQAIYTVPSVSLNDLSARGTFSNNNVRVNCIMNLGGKAGAPRVTFDFDIPNVNDDELRMVRSLISTEEERNLQVIYLLGIGRFYTYDYTGTQTQSSTAMNSLLSSTLSGQLNQVFTSLMGGNQNWNIGANLSTGETGWSDMDVEGMLSGRLLNNRLLINGNFGYRDNPVAASNFIGDFDLQWILNKQGNLILKAYSETNDRYFTKSALTTQGVGILLKKDFIRWSDLFRKKK